MSQKTSARKLFKDYFDRAAARALGDQIARVWPAFDRERFVHRASRGLGPLEFQSRVQRFADALAQTLPSVVPDALDILTASLPPPLPSCDAVTEGWLQWPVGQFIADHGVPHLDASMAAMIALTQRFSAEFAVRPFIDCHPEAVLGRLRELTDHPSPHVRRWCSEGPRPRLPWGRRLRRLMEDPRPLAPILEALKDDPEMYVRRSVANCLNDIAKDHPDWVVARCRKWRGAGPSSRAAVISQALRTLIKSGHEGALDVEGFGAPKQVAANLRVRPREISLGESVELTATLRSCADASQALMVDCVVHYVRAQGTSAKVFKWTTVELAPGASMALVKRHPMRVTTIRRLYPGRHRVELQVNGVRLAQAWFLLRDGG